MTPALCGYHAILYAAKAKRLGRIHHPGAGRAALTAEAARISDQCCRKRLGLRPRWRP